MGKAIVSYEKLGLYISNGTFTFDISNSPTLKSFEKVIGVNAILVAKCVPNTEEYFALSYNKDGTLSKKNREYLDPNDEDYDGKKIDYIEENSYWTDEDNEWLYFLVYDVNIIKIGMTITSPKARYESYSCGTDRAMKKGSCSTTNFIISECNSLALDVGCEVKVYGIPLPKKTVVDNSWGETTEISVSIARGMEKKLTNIFTKTYGYKPVLCVQEGK
jgi:hypothetical protein